MPDVKISSGADPVTVVATDKVPMARSASTTAYAATVAEIATYANGAYVPPYYTGTPSMDATGAAGTAAFVARGDHVHPSDTSRVAKGGDTMTGLLTLSGAPTATLHAATKGYVDGSAPVGGPYLPLAGGILTGALTPMQTGGLVGTTTNNNASVGSVGEMISASVVAASAVPITSNVQLNITSITLTAGDWDVSGEIWITIGTGGATTAQASLNTVSATLSADSSVAASRWLWMGAIGASTSQVVGLRPCRASLSATTVYYLVASVAFPSGTCTGTGTSSRDGGDERRARPGVSGGLMLPPPFVIFSLPRCRTKWLSVFLQYGNWQCGHDELRHCRSLDDVTSWLAQPCTGTVETAAAPFWRLLPEGVRVVTLRRPVPEVVASLARAGISFDAAVMTRVIQHHERKLDQIEARVPGVLAIRFEELATEATCARVFEHCLGLPHDPAWWAAASAVNIQINLPHLMRYFAAHGPQMEKLAKTAKHRTIANMAREPREIDGVTFQHEPFRQFYRDAQALFAEHLVQTEQSPDDHARKNLPLFEALDDAGMLQTITARGHNGLMYGYLQTVIGPTLDAPDVLQGWHSIFFASPDIRGLGMKLQRAALAALRERGVDEVVMRAGHRGSGPRIGTFYRRLGAEEFGNLYRLELA